MGETSAAVLLLGMEHYSALGAVRSLGRCGIRVYGVHASARAPAVTSRYCQGVFVCDLEREPAQASVEFLFAIARRLAGRPVLLATNDQTALFLAENCSKLARVFRFPTNSLPLIRALHNKREMYLLAKALGIPTVHTIFPRSRDDVVDFAGRTQFPVILKAIDNIPVYRRTGKTTTVITRTREELLARYDAMEDPSKPNLELQEYVPVRAESNWTFNGYFNHDSDCLFGMTGHKIHQAPPYTGVISLGVCRPNQAVQDLTLKLVKGVHYKGVIDVGFLYDARDGTYKLHDVNPRLGASFRMFVGTGGLDVARAAYLDLTGQPVPPSGISEGRKWAVEDADLMSSYRYLRDRTQTIREWIAGYDGLAEGAWFAGDDPRPFLHVCGLFCARMFRSLESKVRRRPILPQASLTESDRSGVEAARL